MRKATLLFAILLATSTIPASAQNTPAQGETYASASVLDEQGREAFIAAARDVVTGTPTVTYLYYGFCTASCIFGYGVIPNEDFAGTFKTNWNQPNVFTLNVDTSAVPGFNNFFLDGGSPAPGGVISLTLTKTNADWEVTNSATITRTNGELTQDFTATDYFASARIAGTVFGTTATPGPAFRYPGALFLGTSTSKTFADLADPIADWMKRRPGGKHAAAVLFGK